MVSVCPETRWSRWHVPVKDCIVSYLPFTNWASAETADAGNGHLVRINVSFSFYSLCKYMHQFCNVCTLECVEISLHLSPILMRPDLYPCRDPRTQTSSQDTSQMPNQLCNKATWHLHGGSSSLKWRQNRVGRMGWCLGQPRPFKPGVCWFSLFDL